MSPSSVCVQAEDFDTGAEITALRHAHPEAGAVVAFIGQVREFSAGCAISAMALEHYPGMTERVLQALIAEATRRWPVAGVRIIHRVGHLAAGDQIVLVAVTATHRDDSFNACAFIMDALKTEAPFWKKEQTPQGERWVEARSHDHAARQRWG